MRRTFLSFTLLLAAACPSAAGVWTRTGPESMRFEGSIELGEYDRFALVFDASVRELVVTSPGGVTTEGIRIGLALAAHDVKVTVVGECLSSCANYLFVGGHRREIRGGVVGYHGNVQACFSGARRGEMLARWREHGMNDEDVRRNLERLERDIAEEARFLGIMGVSQELFDRSCTPDKGAGDGGEYAFLLPRRETFEKYGLYGIVGGQDPEVMKSLRWPYLHD